jgi:hypothetical protein
LGLLLGCFEFAGEEVKEPVANYDAVLWAHLGAPHNINVVLDSIWKVIRGDYFPLLNECNRFFNTAYVQNISEFRHYGLL